MIANTTTAAAAAAAGDPNHPQHERWLLELGRVTYASSQVATACFNLSRTHGEHTSLSLQQDTLGRAAGRLQDMVKERGSFQQLDDFVAELGPVVTLRNDVMHALTVRDGLHRRRADDPTYVRNYFEIADLRKVNAALVNAAHLGQVALYADGGKAIERWRSRPADQQ